MKITAVDYYIIQSGALLMMLVLSSCASKYLGYSTRRELCLAISAAATVWIWISLHYTWKGE